MDVRIDIKDIDKIDNAMLFDNKNVFGGKYSKVFRYAVHECRRIYRERINKAIKTYMRDPNWIDTRDNLPPEGAQVLLTVTKGRESELVIAFRTNTPWNNSYLWYSDDDNYRTGILPQEVTAWMPLPQPYKRIWER